MLVLYDWSICQHWLIVCNIIFVIQWYEQLPLCSILCRKVSFSQFPPSPPCCCCFFSNDTYFTVTGACFSFHRCSWLAWVVVLAIGAQADGWVRLETHKGLKRVTRVQCLRIFTFTIFRKLSDQYPF